MTTLLEEAFARAAQLPPKEQDALAALLLEEIAAEKQWAGLFSQSQDELSRLAEEALAEFREGKTVPLDEDDMFSPIPPSASGKPSGNYPLLSSGGQGRFSGCGNITLGILYFILSKFTLPSRFIPSA